MVETIVIIGGGYTGVITAALLSRLNNSDGQPLYKIILLEERQYLLDGASKIISRLHLGGEYPQDTSTGLACLKGAILFKQMLPAVYTTALSTSFIISRVTENSGILTIEKAVQNYKKIQNQYEAYFKEFEKIYGGQKAQDLLFGPPDDFFSVFGEVAYTHGFAGGIKTKEKGINPVLLGAFLENYIYKQKVSIYTNHKVVNAIPTNAGFQITALHNGKEIIFNADQVVNASWHNAFFLNSKIASQNLINEKVYAYLRCIAIIDISRCKEKPGAILGMSGEHGGAYSPINDKIAFIYFPHEEGSYLGEMEQNELNPQINSEWEKIMDYGPMDSVKRQKLILSTLQKKYPFLAEAKVLSLMTRPTLASKHDISKRRHTEVMAIDSKGQWLSSLSMKATFAPMVALETLQKVQMNSFNKGSISKNDLIYKTKDLPIILPKELALYDDYFETQDYIKYAQKFAKCRNFPLSIVG